MLQEVRALLVDQPVGFSFALNWGQIARFLSSCLDQNERATHCQEHKQAGGGKQQSLPLCFRIFCFSHGAAEFSQVCACASEGPKSSECSGKNASLSSVVPMSVLS